jgi:imidazolonepropionase-like amidohydrolase
MSQQILFKNFELLEPSFGELRGGYQLLVEGDTIKELSDRPIKVAEADVIDCGKRTLMPGLIDCHVHAIHSEVNVRFMEMLPLTLVTARAATRLSAMLDRGFTTVRDTGGADWGIKTAIETGHITGPRLYIAGQSIGPPAAIRIRAGAPIASAATTNAPAVTACSSNPRSPMGRRSPQICP